MPTWELAALARERMRALKQQEAEEDDGGWLPGSSPSRSDDENQPDAEYWNLCPPAQSSIWQTELRHGLWTRAALRVAAVALSVELYRIEHGAWPASLEQLGEDISTTDPLSGEPLTYTPTERGVMIYSVGWNQADDGGTREEGHDGWELDIVFELFDPSIRGALEPEPIPEYSREYLSEQPEPAATQPAEGE
jgi:hypothetical protein